MSQNQKPLDALNKIIPILKKYDFEWLITGGFASHVHGVNRPITDIDIDIHTSKDSKEFKDLLVELAPFITQPLEHFVDQNYDNYNFEVEISGQIIDICPSKEMKVYNKETGKYECFYSEKFPKPEIIEWNGLKLPLLPKELVIKNKEILVWQRESDLNDINGLKTLLL